MTLILILATMAVPAYLNAIRRAREAVLRDDLYPMRKLIDEYTIDKQQPPQSLQDMVTAGYLRAIPVDPFTRRQDWHTSEDNVVLTPEQTQFGITDVHSASNQISPFEKTPYSSW